MLNNRNDDYSGPGDLEQSVSSAPSAQSRVPSHNCSKRIQVESDMQRSSPSGHLSGLKVVSGPENVSLPLKPSSISSINTSDSRSTNSKIVINYLRCNNGIKIKIVELITHVQLLWRIRLRRIHLCSPRYHRKPCDCKRENELKLTS